MVSETRAKRLVDEFEEAAYSVSGAFNISHGIAAVLRHLADAEAGYIDPESFYAVPGNLLEALANRLTAPTVLERALSGDPAAARQFLHEAGFTDVKGNWLPQYQPTPLQ